MLLTHDRRNSSGGRWPPEPRGIAATGTVLIAMLAAVAALPGCSAGTRTPDRPASARTPGVPAEQALLPPIYAAVYGSTEAQLEIKVAEQRLTAQCMSRAGFAYPVRVAGAADDAGSRPKPFGLESLSVPVVPTESEGPKTGTRSDSTAFTRALYGDDDQRVKVSGAKVWVSRPATGCVAEAEKRLLGNGRQRWIQLRIIFFEAEREARRQLDDDRAFQALNERWRACMRQDGHDLADPLRVLSTLPPRADLAANPLARADLDCKARTDYFATAYARLAVTQRTVLDRYPDALADWKSLLQRQRAAARATPGR